MSLPWLKQDKQPAYEKRERTNRDLYDSGPWRRLRKVYIEQLTEKQFKMISELEEWHKPIVIESIPVCEVCLKLLIDGAYKEVNKGKICDHIICVNPSDSKDNCDGYFGDGLDINNLQLLCHEHHNRKGARDQRYQKAYRGG